MSNTGEDGLTKDTPMNPDLKNMGYNYWTKEQMNNWLVANGLTVRSVGESKQKCWTTFFPQLVDMWNDKHSTRTYTPPAHGQGG